MIISTNWLNEFIDISNLNSEQICGKLNSIGLEVDSVSRVSVPAKIVVAKVLTCEAHENSDHLHVCSVDVGGESPLQIVCGAPNVAAEQFVACALVGATMPNGMEIKKAKLRGVESSGMLCSASELGLPKLNDGIMLLDDSIGELALGKELREYPLFNDVLIEIELTPNRGDCLSIRGVARDLSAAFDLPLIAPEGRPSDDTLTLGIGRILGLKAEEGMKASFSYHAIELNKQPKNSLKTALRLALVGESAKTPIESALAYATHASGVLFRAYDYGKLASGEGEKINFEIKEDKNSSYAVWCGEKLLSVAGISQSECARVDENSKIVIVEANYTEPQIIARSVGEDKEQPKDEAVYRSSRGSEPALEIGEDLLRKLCFKNASITIYSGAQQYIYEKEPIAITCSHAELKAMIGADVPQDTMIRILKRLGFGAAVQGEQLYVKVPAFRHDVVNSHDICEEIVRIIGIDEIPAKPLVFAEANRLSAAAGDYKKAKTLRQKAANAGFFECVHYVFDNPEELAVLGFKPCKVEILNPLSGEFGALKPTLVNHLLNSAERNAKNGRKAIKLFEKGEVFDENGTQISKMGFVISGLEREPSLLNGAKPNEVKFYYFAALIQSVLGKITLKKSANAPFLSEFEQAEIFVGGEKIGYLGRLNLNIEMSRDLGRTYVCELDFDKIPLGEKIAREYSKLPSVTRDLSLLVPRETSYGQIKECIKSLKIEALKDFLPVDIYEGAALGKNESLTIKFTFQAMERTLSDEEIAGYTDQILAELKMRLNIGLR